MSAIAICILCNSVPQHSQPFPSILNLFAFPALQQLPAWQWDPPAWPLSCGIPQEQVGAEEGSGGCSAPGRSPDPHLWWGGARTQLSGQEEVRNSCWWPHGGARQRQHRPAAKRTSLAVTEETSCLEPQELQFLGNLVAFRAEPRSGICCGPGLTLPAWTRQGPFGQPWLNRSWGSYSPNIWFLSRYHIMFKKTSTLNENMLSHSHHWLKHQRCRRRKTKPVWT